MPNGGGDIDKALGITKKLEESKMEKIIKTVTIEGVDFDFIEKPKTIYAGFHIVAPDIESEPDVINTYDRFVEGHTRIIDSVMPECMICLSIAYGEWNKTKDIIREFMHGKETTNIHQPEGITVLEMPSCIFIRVKATDEAWTLTKKITGEDNPQWHMAPLFGLIEALFCTPEYGFTDGSEGNHATEYYHFDGTQYAAIPVSRV